MKRFSVKHFVQGETPFAFAALIPIFQRWIQEHKLDGLLIDVADYQHVHQGPGIVLIGHEADLAFDQRAGRAGLSYIRKRALAGSLGENLELAFKQLAKACQLLELETDAQGVRFDYDSAEITFLDRLNSPNTPEAFERLQPDVRTFAARFFQNEAVRIESTQADKRKCLSVEIARG